MTSSIQKLLADLITDARWPAASLQAATPAFSELFHLPAAELDFDRWEHATETAGWSWQPVHPPGVVEPLQLYRPVQWDRVDVHANTARLADATRIRQSAWFGTRTGWQRDLPRFLASSDLIAFDYRVLGVGECRWLCVTGGADGWWTWAFHAFEDRMAMIKGDADDPACLELQLAALVNARPYGC